MTIFLRSKQRCLEKQKVVSTIKKSVVFWKSVFSDIFSELHVMIFYILLVFVVAWIIVVYQVFIHDGDENENLMENERTEQPSQVLQDKISSQHLKWPPMLQDGSIPSSDGFDSMPLTNLSVPKFWVPTISDLNKIGSKVNGDETIFLMIASYRDFQCRETVASAFMRAASPERLFVGIVDQVLPGDVNCVDTKVSCSELPEQPLCKYRDQISVYKMDARFSTGKILIEFFDAMVRASMIRPCYCPPHWR